VTDVALGHLATCAHLEDVTLHDCGLTDSVTHLLATFHLLKKADLSCNDELTDVTAEHLSKCVQLEEVVLDECGLMTDAALEHLSKCPRLTKVHLGGGGELTSLAAVHLAKCTHLENMELGTLRENLLSKTRFRSYRRNFDESAAKALAACKRLTTISPFWLARRVAEIKAQTVAQTAVHAAVSSVKLQYSYNHRRSRS
jgi:hypothetical protein